MFGLLFGCVVLNQQFWFSLFALYFLSSLKTSTVEFHPGYLVCDVLKKIASCTNSSKECLCKVSKYMYVND